MTTMRLVVRQATYDRKLLLRDPAAFFFGLALPVIFLFIFATVFGNETVESRGIKVSTYYVPTIVALGLISTTFTNLAITLTAARERGILKRLRGTPLPPSVFLAGKISGAVLSSVSLTVVLVAIGALAYGVSVPGETLPGVAISLAVGAAAFCSLGIAMTVVIPTEAAAPAVVNAVILPLYFISGTFFPMDDAPAWLTTVADAFPVVHLSEALLTAFDPLQQAPGIDWGELGIVALWGVAGAVVAMRSFRWSPAGQ